MDPLLYHSFTFSAPQGVQCHFREIFPPKAISSHSNYIRARDGSLAYARHVRNLQAPLVDAVRQCAAPIRMVSPLRMLSPPFQSCQSSPAWF